MPTPPTFGRRGVAMAAASPTYGAPPPRSAPPPRDGGVSSGPSPFAPILRFCFSFEGRLRRRDYWLAQIVLTVVSLPILWFDLTQAATPSSNPFVALLLSLFWLTLCIGLMWSSLAIQVKRWHDRDKPWFWLFIAFVPFIGGLWAFIELGCLDGTAGENRFGHSPKFGPAATFD